MKKIVALGAIAALAGGMIFADEPAIDTKIAAFDGNAEVKWGVDLDAGQHGFTNNEGGNLKVNLWNEGTKATSGDGIWAELEVKGNAGKVENSTASFGSYEIKKAALHFNDAYISILKGGTTVGGFSLPGAVGGEKMALGAKGIDFTQGIEAGYDAEAFKFALNFRSMPKTTNYTSSYGLSFTAELKDKLVSGLTANAGVSYNLSENWKDVAVSDKMSDTTVSDHLLTEPNWKDGEEDYVNLHVGSLAMPEEIKDGAGNAVSFKLKNGHTVGYGFNAGYKFAIDDKYYVKPSAGLVGSYTSGSTKFGTEWKNASVSENEVIAGVLFGWGDINKDDNAGVPYLDAASAKKVSPGVSVNVRIPLTTTYKVDDTTVTKTGALKALIVPSFYLGDLVENLNFAAYSEIGLYSYVKPEDRYKEESKTITIKGTVNENETLAMAVAAGISYKIAIDDVTVTPKGGFRYANSAFVANGTSLSGVFADMGIQKAAKADAKKTYDADFFNLKVGVDVGGLLNNTTFSVNYTSANLLNGVSDADDSSPRYDKDKKYYNVKLGTFEVGCKISI